METFPPLAKGHSLLLERLSELFPVTFTRKMLTKTPLLVAKRKPNWLLHLL